ncbi:MAG TPA: hypothetical protein VGY53_01860 [Isosphaeraceae bacterium]|nr:hypothetical protein [Isosphaeraceae bacterium]
MNKRRWIFFATLALFGIWVAALGVLAVVSGEKPPGPKAAPPGQQR